MAAVRIGHCQRGMSKESQSCIKYSVVQVAPAIYAAFLPYQSVRISPNGFCPSLLCTTHNTSNPRLDAILFFARAGGAMVYCLI